MKAVFADVPEHFLEARQRAGADQWDEMWDGVLHMPPMPLIEHQDLAAALQNYLWLRWAKPIRAKVFHEVNLAAPGGWPSDYRIPDLLLLTRERFGIRRRERFEGAPDAVVEIHSPGDETYEKLPFYEELRVPEVWVIHRDTKVPEIYVLRRHKLKKQRASAEGWVKSPGIGVELKKARGSKLAIRLTGDDQTREELPED